MEYKIEEIPFIKNYIIGIPLVSIVMFFAEFPWDTPQTWTDPLWFFVLINFLIVLTITTAYWVGCQTIVTWTWKKYPWHLEPTKHLIIEVLLLLGLIIIISSIQLLFITDESSFSNIQFIIKEFFAISLTVFLLSTIHEAMFFYFQWQRNFKKSAILEKENIQGRYENLMAQINPHFLFNNLNTLTTIVENNEEGVEYIQNLSDYLRNTLKQDEQQTRSIEKEFQHLKKYIYLQKKRFRNALQIKNSVKQKDYSKKILSFSLQMLIENAIKHNIINENNPLTISIYANKTHLIVKNNLQKKNIGETTKLGLKNIQKRYKYFTSEEVLIKKTKNQFSVSIPFI